MAVALESMPPMPSWDEEDGIFYPWWEEEPVVQGDTHLLAVVELVNMAHCLLRDRPEARAFSDVFIYWERGNVRKKVAPDLYVLPKVEHQERERRSARLWREASRPVFVLEVLSKLGKQDEMGHRFDVYQGEIGIPEYFVCDPAPHPMRLWGYRLADGKYLPADPDEQGRLWSEELGAWFGLDSRGWVQIWDSRGAAMPKYREAVEAAELARRQARLAVRDAEAMAEHADEETRRAEEEARRRASAEARVRELEEELRRLKGQA